MATWYQHLVWLFLQGTYGKRLKRFYHIRVSGDLDEPGPPFIFLSNHAHKTDPFLLGAVIGYPVNYMANVEAVSFMKRLGGAMVGVYAKKKGQNDLAAVRATFDLIRHGHAVGIFAEGDRCWDGETEPIVKALPALIQKLRVPVRLARMKGNYLSWPRWAEFPRQGEIHIHFSTLRQAEYRSMAREELAARINTALYRNEVKDPELQCVSFQGTNLAEGVQYLIWICPNCNSHDSIYGRGDRMVCNVCGCGWTLDGNLRITPEAKGCVDLKGLFDWQNSEIASMIKGPEDIPLTVSEDVYIRRSSFGGMEEGCTGSLLLFPRNIEIVPDKGDRLILPVHEITSYVDNFNRYFQFYHKGDRYRIRFMGKNACKWIFFLRKLQNL